MVLYVVYRAPRESKDRSVIPHRLKALGCRKMRRSFWEVDEEKVNRVLRVLEKNQPILLKRVREIRKPRIVRDKGVFELGSLVIVMYATPKEAKREKIRNVLRKAPYIRLCRSVYAFSQKHSLFDKNNELVDALKFTDFIKELREYVKVIPRVVIANKGSIERLLEETRQRVENEISDITRCCKELYDKALEGGYEVRRMQDSLSKNKRRFVTVKKVAAFYKKWLGMDFSRSLLKAYRAVAKVNSILNRK
jgi:uncharacterized protein (UPF0335 family)